MPNYDFLVIRNCWKGHNSAVVNDIMNDKKDHNFMNNKNY